jgi:acetyl-CoA carboxylase carboxyltransferase component
MADIVNHDGGEQAENAELGGQQAAYESGSVYLMYSRDAPVVEAEFQMFSKITGRSLSCS